jgi:hypothetical protein
MVRQSELIELLEKPMILTLGVYHDVMFCEVALEIPEVTQ